MLGFGGGGKLYADIEQQSNTYSFLSMYTTKTARVLH